MESLHYLLMKTHTHLNRWILNEASHLGLSSGQPKVLECLAHYGECNQKTIAAYCEIEPATVGSIVTRMEQAGLVCRTQKEGNRRALYVSLTPKGQERSDQMAHIFRQADLYATAALSQEEQTHLRQLLETVCASIYASTKEVQA